MNVRQFLDLIGRKKQTIASALVVFLAIAIVFSAASPFKYNSQLTLLVVHDSNGNTDPYTASRSNEYLSDLLARIVSSGSFFAKIKDSSFKIDKNYFNGDEKKQMKEWNKTAKAKSLPGTGSISINVYHTDRRQTEEIARAVAYTLQTTNSQYHGFGNSVEIKIIDEPITSKYPVIPSVPLNLGLAIVFALIFSLSYIYLFPEERYDFRLWPKKKKKEELEETEDEEAVCQINFSQPIAVPEEVEIIEEEIKSYREEEKKVFNVCQPEDFQNSGSMENILRR